MNDVLDLQAFRTDPHAEGVRVCAVPNATDWEGVSQALQDHPALHFYVISRYRAAVSDALTQEWLYKQAARQAFARLRAEGVAIGEAGETKELQPEVVAAYRTYLEAERECGKWRALAEGLERKADSLQQISSRQKEELKKNWQSYRDPQEN